MKDNKIQMGHTKIVISRIYLLSLLIRFSLLILLSSCILLPSTSIPKDLSTLNAIYYIDDGRGSDTNLGSQTEPWKTLQKCLDWVQAGDTCQILGGTYNESLVLKTSGTETSPIVLKADGVVIVNSGTASTTIRTNGPVSYYIIDGLQLISTRISFTQSDYSITIESGIWNGITDKNAGNAGFIFRNCYVEGSLYFYARNNIVENCEFNGKGTWHAAITEKFGPSHDNIYRNNTIHDYSIRGIWSMQYTENTLIEGNTIYNVRELSVDCDGAGNRVDACNVIGNRIYDTGTAILLENTFDSIVKENVIYNAYDGIGYINYGAPIADAEYRNMNTNTLSLNNVIYNVNNGITCHDSPGGSAINNTIYKTTQNHSYFAGIALATPSGEFYCKNWTVKNNIVSQSRYAALWIEVPPTLDINLNSNYNLFDFGTADKKFHVMTFNPNRVDVDYTLAQWHDLGYDGYSTLGDPLFANVAIGDFHLNLSSPACTAGENGTYIGAFPCY